MWLDFGRFLVGCGVGLSCYAVTTIELHHLKLNNWLHNTWILTLCMQLFFFLCSGTYICCRNHPQNRERSLNVSETCMYLAIRVSVRDHLVKIWIFCWWIFVCHLLCILNMHSCWWAVAKHSFSLSVLLSTGVS